MSDNLHPIFKPIVENLKKPTASISSTDLLAALKSYRCEHSKDDEGNGLELSDMLTPDDQPSITKGLLELESLAEHLAINISS